jgi:hypothetical protein
MIKITISKEREIVTENDLQISENSCNQNTTTNRSLIRHRSDFNCLQFPALQIMKPANFNKCHIQQILEKLLQKGTTQEYPIAAIEEPL